MGTCLCWAGPFRVGSCSLPGNPPDWKLGGFGNQGSGQMDLSESRHGFKKTGLSRFAPGRTIMKEAPNPRSNVFWVLAGESLDHLRQLG